MKLIQISFFAFATITFLVFPQPLLAADFDVYVDKDAGDDGDGSKDSPYKSIKKALEKAKNGDKIKIAGGTYDDVLSVEKEVALSGSGRSKTNITGQITAKKKLLIKDLTIATKQGSAVLVEDGVSFEVEGVEFKNFGRMGINALPGKGKITVEDSTFHGGGKGVYAQRGRSIEIVRSRFYDNKEEALDIRNNVSGIIKNNAIYSNSEGGIEIIIGDSDVEITNNKITKNKASGIAAQFYSSARRDGKIVISNNTISGNGKFGLDCNIPSGGNPSPGYWARSLELVQNTLEQNKNEEISQFCKIIEAVDKEEEKDNAITETAPIEEVNTQPAANTLSEEELKKEEETWQEVERLTTSEEEKRLRMEAVRQKVESRQRVQRFFTGTRTAEFDQLRQDTNESLGQLDRIKELATTTPSLQNNEALQRVINEQAAEIQFWQDFLSAEESKLSIYTIGEKIFKDPKKLLPWAHLL